MKNRFFTFVFATCAVSIAVSVSGCATVGGRSVSSEMTGNSILVKYRSVGTSLSPLSEYALIESANGLGILETTSGASKAFVIDWAWRDDQGDHFVLWGEAMGYRGNAWEFIVPEDRRQEASGYIYPVGTFSIVRLNGLPRPVPHKFNPIPDFRLVPEPASSKLGAAQP